jgi:hypothetical protein
MEKTGLPRSQHVRYRVPFYLSPIHYILQEREPRPPYPLHLLQGVNRTSWRFVNITTNRKQPPKSPLLEWYGMGTQDWAVNMAETVKGLVKRGYIER